jgi:hypothetical protein
MEPLAAGDLVMLIHIEPTSLAPQVGLRLGSIGTVIGPFVNGGAVEWLVDFPEANAAEVYCWRHQIIKIRRGYPGLQAGEETPNIVECEVFHEKA